MDEAAIIIVALRFLAPFLILRFPITGVGLCMLLDWRDHDYLGQYEHYQIIDKWLDFYYLTFCAYMSLAWKDIVARRLVMGLFIYRFIGVIALALTNQEWLMILFPNLFEVLFIFYILYAQFSKSTHLFHSWKSITPVMLALAIPKLVQEYMLHVYLPYPNLTPGWVMRIMELPQIITLVPLTLIPIILLVVYIVLARKRLSEIKQ